MLYSLVLQLGGICLGDLVIGTDGNDDEIR